MNFNLDMNWLNVSKGSLSMSGSTDGGGGGGNKSVEGGNEQKQVASGITAEGLQEKIEGAVETTRVDVVDMSGGCGNSFEAVIVSPQFASKTLLQRHRLVNSAIKDEVAAIHAWTPKCFTPEEFEKKAGEVERSKPGITQEWDTKTMSATHSRGKITQQ